MIRNEDNMMNNASKRWLPLTKKDPQAMLIRSAQFLLSAFLLSGTGTAISSHPASAQELTPSTTATDAPVTRRARMDPKHPLHIGSDYYPRESIRNRQQGVCYVAFLIKADGSVPAIQLLKSSGYPRLDTACIESVIDVPMLPAIVNGTPVTGWTDFPLVWIIDRAQPLNRPEKSAVPRIADDYELRVGKEFYPESGQAGHPKGYCVVHVVVDATGTVRDAHVTQSTASGTADHACLAAIKPARFTPELQNGLPVEDSTDIAIYW
jgi:TonB family protein